MIVRLKLKSTKCKDFFFYLNVIQKISIEVCRHKMAVNCTQIVVN